MAFSVNPLNNCYDEALLNSNWGLGETVVAGLVSPDSFTVDKAAMKITARAIGGKEKARWLEPGGGVRQTLGLRRGEPSLTDAEALAVTELLKKVEALYGKPVDIEWAYFRGELYLLQARPITTYVPLPPELVTAPGERRRLYIDFTISTQGILRPLSPMGTSVFRALTQAVGRKAFSMDMNRNVEDALLCATSGRVYLNLSNAFALLGRDRVAGALANMDPAVGEGVRGGRRGGVPVAERGHPPSAPPAGDEHGGQRPLCPGGDDSARGGAPAQPG